jgi:hypothetical protein
MNVQIRKRRLKLEGSRVCEHCHIPLFSRAVTFLEFITFFELITFLECITFLESITCLEFITFVEIITHTTLGPKGLNVCDLDIGNSGITLSTVHRETGRATNLLLVKAVDS